MSAPTWGTNTNMSVYVDNARIPYGRMKMCHMVADSAEELMEFALALGLKREWAQSWMHSPHFDISLGKRKKAIEAGAIEIGSRKIIQVLQRWRKGGGDV